MIWERGGTIDFVNGSATVTGTGTTWATSAVLAGYGLIGPDLLWYEIEAVNSSTEITLSTAYEGPTAAGQAYVIVPTAGANEKIHADVQEFLALARGKLDDIDTTLATLQADYDVWKAAKIAEIDALITTKTGELDALYAAKSGELNTLISGGVDAINALIATKTTELDALKTAKEGELDTLISNKTTEIDALITTKTTELDDLHSAKESTLDALIAAKTTEINTLISDKTTALDGLIATKTSELDALKTAKEGELDTLISNKTTEIDALITTKTTELDALIAAKSAAADSMISTKGTAVDDMITAKGAAADAMIAAKQAEVDALLTLLSAGGGNSAKNLIINGDMKVDQRNKGAAVTGITAGGYVTVDRWQVLLSGAGTWTAQQGSGMGPHSNSLRLTCTTAQASLASSAYGILITRLEGQDLQHLRKGTASAESLSLSLLLKSNVTYTFPVEIYDSDNTRHICGTMTVNAADTEQAVSFTWAGDTTGAFNDDANGSLNLYIWFVAGSQFSSGTLATSWQTHTDADRAVGCSNLAAYAGNYIEITGVQLEAGSVVSDFVHESYGETLTKCEPYCELYEGPQMFLYKLRESARDRTLSVQFRTKKRADATITILSSDADGGGAIAAVGGRDGVRFGSVATADGQAPRITSFLAESEI